MLTRRNDDRGVGGCTVPSLDCTLTRARLLNTGPPLARMKSSRQAKKPNGGTTRIDRLAGIAGELTDAEQRENVPRRQRRSSPVGNKRKSASPVPAPREAAETSPTEDDAPNIARNRAVPPAAQALLRERAAPPLQPPQPARALPPRVVHHTDIMADSDCSPAAAAAVPVDIGGAQMEAPPQPVEVPRGRRVAHTNMLRFGPALPLAPRIPKALTETRTAANRARDSTEDDNTPPDSAAEENVPAEAAQGEQAAAAQNGNPDAAGAGPAVHNRAAPTPAGSSDTAADLDLEADLAPEQDVPNDGAEALVYPNSYRRARRDRTRSLNRMAQRLPQLPPVDGDAVLIRPPPMRLPQKAPASAGPQTPAGLPIRAELGSGKNATINTTGRTAQEKDKAPAVDSVAAAWQLNGMAGDEAGPSDPRAGDSSEANSAAKAAHNRVGKESSPRKRRRSSGAFSGASPQKCLRISASGAMAVSMAPTPEKAAAALQATAAAQLARPQPAGPSRDDLNKQLLQRLKEEADLGIEAMQSHTLFRLSEEGLEHLAMQRGRQQRIKVSHDRQVLEVSRLLKTSTAASKIVQETQERIKELQQALRGYIAAAEVSRVEAVAAMRSQAIIKEDMENAVRDVAGLLGAKPADIEHLTASMAAQHAHVGVLRGAHEEISRKLQFTRDEKVRLLRELDSRDDADAA
ncbi:hypothetical protein WJX75_005204 [Coccomyxa subellipsoidea]|uniref:Uncharacterized protein n=1 Tax=Coccomyxa subellipsoidea TaxID=248742 RepID=A0ABR2Z0R5_9CHLO